jgi:hypothetical protein
LSLREGGEDTSVPDARQLLDECRAARVQLRLRKKKGTATLAGVERELTQIKRRSRALLERMTKADGHIFGEWADAAHAEGEDRETATQEWLELKRLLEVSAERADMAAKGVMKNSPAVAKGSKGGRPPDTLADLITSIAANIYEQRTGATASRVIDALNKPCGDFHEFLERVFEALGIESSADASNARLQQRLGRKQ